MLSLLTEAVFKEAVNRLVGESATWRPSENQSPPVSSEAATRPVVAVEDISDTQSVSVSTEVVGWLTWETPERLVKNTERPKWERREGKG